MTINGIAVKIIRERTGIKRAAFASRIGVSESYLRDIETGRRLLKRNEALIFRITQELAVPLGMITYAIGGQSVCESDQ